MRARFTRDWSRAAELVRGFTEVKSEVGGGRASFGVMIPDTYHTSADTETLVECSWAGGLADDADSGGGAVLWFWQDSLAARESANAAAMEACSGLGLQFLDGTVAFARVALIREAGRLKLRRTYVFDYTANEHRASPGLRAADRASGRVGRLCARRKRGRRPLARAEPVAPYSEAQPGATTCRELERMARAARYRAERRRTRRERHEAAVARNPHVA